MHSTNKLFWRQKDKGKLTGVTRAILVTLLMMFIVAASVVYVDFREIPKYQTDAKSSSITTGSSTVSATTITENSTFTTTTTTVAARSSSIQVSTANSGEMTEKILVLPINGSSVLYAWNDAMFQLRLEVNYSSSPDLDLPATLPNISEAALTALYVKYLSSSSDGGSSPIVFNSDLSLLAKFAFDKGVVVSRFLGEMRLNASEERAMGDTLIVPDGAVLQNVTIMKAPLDMIFGAINNASSTLTNYTSIRIGDAELTYFVGYPTLFYGITCGPPSNCGNGEPKPGMRWIGLSLFVQNLDFDNGTTTVISGSQIQYNYSDGSCAHSYFGNGPAIRAPGEYSDDAGTIFQINENLTLSSILY